MTKLIAKLLVRILPGSAEAIVGEYEMPPFAVTPEVVVLGERVFSEHTKTVESNGDITVEYREVFAYALPAHERQVKAQRANDDQTPGRD
jgi:hypothetical protein